MTAATPPKPNNGATASPMEEARARAAIMPITIEQYRRMIEQGIVPEDSTVELLRGMLVRRDRSVLGEDPMGHSPLHKAVIALLTQLAGRIQGEGCHMQIQLPVECPPDGEPEPDTSIIRGTPRDYLERLPGPADVSCIIEVAHSSLERDRDDKLPIYASAGIAQYVIVNLQNRTIEVYTQPDTASAQYRTKTTLEPHQVLTLKLPAGSLDVSASDILP